MRKERDPKSLLRWGLAAVVLTVLLWGLLDIWKIALFCLAAGMPGVLFTNAGIRRKEKKQEESARELEAAQEKRRQEQREQCRQARYSPEERRAVEEHIKERFDPILRWDQEEEPERMSIDIALIPPTEVSPYWRAVTVGAGAISIQRGPVLVRGELAILLPPDWNLENKWPMRLLRDAAWDLLAEKETLGPGAAYRGFSAMSAGFAGAVLLGDLWNQYPLEAAKLPDGGSVFFFWLFPLLKPEWDYYLQKRRYIKPLEQRMMKVNPAADPKRPSCVDPLTWFQEDIAPFVWSQEGKQFCLGLNTEYWRREIFLPAGLSGTGWDWERLSREFLKKFAPTNEPFVEYACEEWVFFAVSEDEEVLRQLALGLRDICGDYPKQAARLLVPDRSAGSV